MARGGLSRLIAEWRGPASRREVDEAIRETRLEELGERSADVVTLPRGAYASVPSREGRVRLLRAARRAARSAVSIHVVISDDRSHAGRIAIDGPRRVLRSVGVPLAEPGDRFGPRRYAHCFFDEEELLGEIAEAGLRVHERRGFTFVLHEAERAVRETAEPFRRELRRAASAVRAAERARLDETPERALAAMRARGARETARGPIGRARLRRAVGWVDALYPGGGNCFRRILLEVALDGGAARETVVFGLDVGSTGHVAFEDREERTFDVAFAIPAPPQA